MEGVTLSFVDLGGDSLHLAAGGDAREAVFTAGLYGRGEGERGARLSAILFESPRLAGGVLM